jgi:hypothetical protein
MTVDEQILGNLERYNEERSRIRNMRVPLSEMSVEVDISPDAKRRYLAELYRKAKATYDKLANQKRQEVVRNLEESRVAVFRPKVVGADPASLQMSMRDALDRLDGISDARELNERLARAHEMGDTVMAKAVLVRGVALGDLGGQSVVDTYLQKFPNEREAYMNYIGAAEEFNKVEKFGVTGTPDEPPELGSAEGRATLRAVENDAPGAA